jgi:outer membrane lipoprotein-sorting protein
LNLKIDETEVKIFRLKSLILIALFISSFYSSVLNADLISITRTKINKSRPFKCDFKQQLVLDKVVELEESGILIIKDAELIKWIYQKPDYKICVLKGSEVKLYDKDFDQLTIYDVKDKKEEFLWKLIFSNQKKKVVENSKERSFKVFNDQNDLLIEVFLNKNYLPEKVIQRDSTGYDRIIKFSNFKIRVKLKKDEFEIEIPPGTDIIKLD